MKLIVLRPEPGAAATAGRAAGAGFDAVVAPMFTVRPLEWEAPDPSGFDAMLMTSANAARYGGAGLASYRHLPVHAVGEATAAAARAAGLTVAFTGEGDAAALLGRASGGSQRRWLHLCGVHSRTIEAPEAELHQVPVYAVDAVSALPSDAAAPCRGGAVALVHSARAAKLFGELIDAAGIAREGVAIVAISDAAAEAAGTGWRGVVASGAPTDAAMLAIARRLCETGA